MEVKSVLEENAELNIETALQRPEKLLTSLSSCSKWSFLHKRLLDLYIEESKNDHTYKDLKCSSSLLAKLVEIDKLNTLVLNLYKGNYGYSLMLKGRDEHFETFKMQYAENELLQYIDNEELPSILLDLLDRLQMNLFYSGCVVCEVRDYRKAANDSYDCKFVLLKPTQQTLQCDINILSSDGNFWTQDDLYALESQLLVHTSPPLCLDPSPAVSIITNKLHNSKNKFRTPLIKRALKKYTQSAINRRRKLAKFPAPYCLRLHDFVTKKRDKLKGAPPVNLKVGKSCVDMWRQREVPLVTPQQIDVLKYAKPLEKTKLTMDNTPIVIEEFTFESERGQGRVILSKLTVYKRVSDEFYLGELYVDRDFQLGENNGSTCKFPLGTRANVEKYVKQFREIFTEEGRRQVKITHQVTGQAPSVSYTHAAAGNMNGGRVNSTFQQKSNAPNNPSNTISAHAILAQAANLAAAITGQQTQGESKKRPMKLSLSICTGTSTATSGSHVTSSPSNNQKVLAQSQHLSASQRLRQAGMVSTVNRPSSAPNTPMSAPAHGIQQQSPIQIPTTPNSRHQHVGTAATLQLTPTHQQSAPHLQQSPQQQLPYTAKLLGANQSGTPPPNVTITMSGTIPTARRTSTVDTKSRVGVPSQCSSAPASAPATPPAADPSGTANQILAAVSAPVTSLSASQHPLPQLINSSATGAPQTHNINIHNITNLQGVNLANLSALQNIQVSVPGVPSGIAVPLCLSNLSVLNPNQQPSVVFSPANVQSNSTLTSTTNVVPDSSPVVPSSTHVVNVDSEVQTASNNTIQATNAGQVTTGMLSVPIGVAGNITQFMTAAGLKGAQGIRPGTPLLLSQVPAQQPFQLLSTGAFTQNAKLQLNTSAQSNQQQRTPAAVSSNVVAATAPTPSVQTQQFLQLAPPHSSMTHVTIQGGAAVLTPKQQNTPHNSS